MKFYNFEFILYNITDLERVLTLCDFYNFQYAYIFHNFDRNDDGTLKVSHIHFQVFLPYQKTFNAVSKLFCIPSNLIEKIKSKTGAIRYLTHIDNKEKYQYSIDDIVTNFDIMHYFDTDKDKSDIEGNAILEIIDFIDTQGFVSLVTVLKFAQKQHIYSHFRRNQYILNQIINQHNIDI